MQICDCPIPNCGCAGGMHTYAPFYQALLKLHKPSRVLEWGPGPNTVMALESGAHVTAIESARDWIPQGGHSAFVCLWIPESHPDYSSLWGEHSADLFFVDGRRRAECVRNIYDVCDENAIVCVHDAQRKRYQSAIHLFDYVASPVHGFVMASKGPHLEAIADRIAEEVTR